MTPTFSPKPDAPDAAAILAAYAAELRYEDIPATALNAAKQCLIDAVACAMFGSGFRWSQIIMGATALPVGQAAVPGTTITTDAGKAALLSGAFAHAFELDSLRKPGAGVHPGATVALPALAMAGASNTTGKELLAAIVAGVEVMFRIGAATLHSAEEMGFHAPGITGVFGSAVACSRLMRLAPDQLRNAMAVGGSMTGGLLQFAASGTGGMIKRVHLGRAAEAGVESARLAAAGYEGPLGILEGRFGILNTFCGSRDPSLLTEGLSTRYEIEKLCIKRYPCHVTAQAAIQALHAWRKEHALEHGNIAAIRLKVPHKIAARHSQKHPPDIALAQYSLPFMLAYSVFHDLEMPGSLTEEGIADPAVHAFADRISVVADETLKGWKVHMHLETTSGDDLTGESSTFVGSPDQPFDEAGLHARFRRLTSRFPSGQTETLLRQLQSIEALPSVRTLALSGEPSLQPLQDGDRTARHV